MKKYLYCKIFNICKHKDSKVTFAFAIRGNQFILIPTIRWKGEEGHTLHFMFLNIVFGFRKSKNIGLSVHNDHPISVDDNPSVTITTSGTGGVCTVFPIEKIWGTSEEDKAWKYLKDI